MKKIVFIFLTIFGLCFQTNIAHAQTEEFYAKIEDTNVEFYSSPSENSALFEIPYSYFVKTNSSVGSFLKSTYKDIDGYVKIGSVKQMVGTPQTPYATATFKVFVSSYLYASPTKNSSVITPVETTDIFSYYGKRNGEQLSSNSNTWYYCSITKNSQTYHGYIFSGITDYLSTIPTNTEVFEEVKNEEQTTPSQEIVSLSNCINKCSRALANLF